jgi:spore germination cell wall hydrolase CwlJ-like protein
MKDRVRTVCRRADYAVLGAIALILAGAVPAVGLNLYKDEIFGRAPVYTVTAPELPAMEQSRRFVAESQCLAEAMYYEARGEGVAGQKAVAEVVLQRLRDRFYPSSVCGVVHEGAAPGHAKGCQFEFACNAAWKVREKAAWREVQLLSMEILLGKVKLHNVTGHAIAFHTVDEDTWWSGGMVQTAQIGNHVFFRRAPRGTVKLASHEELATPAPAGDGASSQPLALAGARPGI